MLRDDLLLGDVTVRRAYPTESNKTLTLTAVMVRMRVARAQPATKSRS